MTRIKGGPYGHLRHKKILKITKGQRGAKHFLFKRANEAMLKSLWYSTRDRRTRKRDLRKLWIARINAAAGLNLSLHLEIAIEGRSGLFQAANFGVEPRKEIGWKLFNEIRFGLKRHQADFLL